MPRDDVISPVGRQIVPAPDLPRPISLASHICYRAISSVRELSGTIGAIDGVVGDETQAALARYQEKHDLSVTGTLTAATLQSLGLRQTAS